ncbi:hypothetical protein SDC9_169958 [bioreactor metagenome]|uniref:Uncharacterized protein n=1 Tax=bioreactor metagenome TaxID=1076179 RepID=A0A645G7G2_9ZZZZ
MAGHQFGRNSEFFAGHGGKGLAENDLTLIVAIAGRSVEIGDSPLERIADQINMLHFILPDHIEPHAAETDGRNPDSGIAV